jgi:hypothetical protein
MRAASLVWLSWVVSVPAGEPLPADQAARWLLLLCVRTATC